MATIIVTGNPVDGLEFFGPFEDGEEAFNYADKNRLEEWWTANLQEVD